MTTITTHSVTGTELHHRYPSQTSPQGVAVYLDCETGDLSAETNPEIGNAVPVREYHGHVLAWTIPALKAGPANDLLAEIEPLAERVCDGYSSEWDGNNHVARFDDDAREAIEAIEALCERAVSDAENGDGLNVWEASDWFGGVGSLAMQADALGITADTTDEELAAIVTREEETAAGEPECDGIEGCAEHLERVRQAAIDADD
jgi:hypothetical protein